MASSNRHWPSLFKSKPCNTHPHQWQHDVSPNSTLVSNGCLRTSPFPPSGAVGGGGDKEERSPEPKPRWNPKPEQIRILEAIFNSGLVNPPRDEIRKIRAQLQEFGNVGDANVFYWFQNRKSRSKNKHRHLLHHHHSPPSPTSSNSSSDKSSSNNKPASSTLTDLTTNGNIILGSAGAAGGNNNNNNYSYATSADFFSTDNSAQFMFLGGGGGGVVAPTYSEGSSSMGFSELSNVVSSGGPSTNMILTELMMKDHHHQEAAKMKMDTQLMMSTYNTTTVSSASPDHPHIPPPSTANTALHLPPSINLSQGVEEQGEMEERPMILVFINDVAFQVCAGPLNLREAFGGDVVLFHSSGQPVLTNEWGDSLSSLQHGASYYLYYAF